jgi:hypothetical protein
MTRWSFTFFSAQLPRGMLAIAVVFGAFLAARLEAGAPSGAPKATFVKGDVQAGPVGGVLAKVKRGQVVDVGFTLKTGDGARAELTFPDGSVVRVGPSSELRLDGAAFDGTTKQVKVEAEVVGGQAWAKVASLVGKDAQFKVKTQNAVAGVRGTVFRVNVDRDEATIVKVYNGSVAVGGAPAILDAPSTQNCKDNPITCGRKQMAAPFQEVSVQQFEHILGRNMQVRIGREGAKAATPTQFSTEEDLKSEPEWVRWNTARDAGNDAEKSD